MTHSSASKLRSSPSNHVRELCSQKNATCSRKNATCSQKNAFCSQKNAFCSQKNAKCILLRAKCILLRVSCILPRASCILPRASLHSSTSTARGRNCSWAAVAKKPLKLTFLRHNVATSLRHDKFFRMLLCAYHAHVCTKFEVNRLKNTATVAKTSFIYFILFI